MIRDTWDIGVQSKSTAAVALMLHSSRMNEQALRKHDSTVPSLIIVQFPIPDLPPYIFL